MSPILILSVLLQIGCAVHVVRTGRPLYWIFILLIGSFIGVAVYLIAEVLPEMRNNRGARRVLKKVQASIDPGRDTRRAEERLELADTQDNRRRLAEQHLLRGEFAEAESRYRAALTGLYRTDPDLMLGLAKAQFGLDRAQDAKQTLDDLIAANPDYRSSDGHLLYARAVEAGGDIPAALHEYETVAQGYPGEEARVRHALLLKKSGNLDKANAVFAEALKRAKLAPDYYRREQREWLEIAKREMG